MAPFFAILGKCAVAAIMLHVPASQVSTSRIAPPPLKDEPTQRAAAPGGSLVGEIKIVGNDVTRQEVILAHLGLYPGQSYCKADLENAEKRLAACKCFENNPSAGIHPTVSVIDPDGPGKYKDILVTVQETKTASFKPMLTLNSDAGPGFGLVLEERNFDFSRWPTSWDDLRSGRAFRGAGQKVYVGINLTTMFGLSPTLGMRR